MIIYGDQNVVVPDHYNFGKYVLDHLRCMQGNNVCMENGITRETLTYKECTQYAVNLSVAFSKVGLQKGDVVAIGSDTFLHYVPTIIAAVFAGAAYTTYDVDIGKAILKHKLELVKPKFFICSLAFWQRHNELLRTFDFIETYIAIDDVPEIKLSLVVLTSSTDVDVDTFEPVEVNGKTDIALILYSSGTTGMPKGVQLTHYNCIVTCMPDAKVIFTTDFSPKCNVQIFRDCQVDIVFSSPMLLHQMIECGLPIKAYWDSVKMVYCRSFPFRAETIQRIKERIPNIEIIQAFGLTECGEPFSQIWTKNKPGSVGIAAPGIIAKVVDLETRAVLGPNQHGEVCVKGHTIMKGYLDIDRFNYLDEDGFYKTGDLGYYDDEEHFYIIDRITDVINSGGIKISPVALETILLQHPGVLDAGVIGKPAPLFNEVPMAFVVKKPGYEVSETELIEFVDLEVTPYMQLKEIVFIAEIPRNPRSKILRRKLRELLAQNSPNDKGE